MKEVYQISLKRPLFIKASDGVALAYYPFLLGNPPGKVIIFYHGGGAYQSHHYQYMACQLQEEHGIASYLVDIRGHGYSKGPRGSASSAAQVWDDIETVINFVRKKHPHAKIYLGGHSAGCGLLLNYEAKKKRSDIAGYIFIAPYLGPFVDVKRPKKDTVQFKKKFKTHVSFFYHVLAMFNKKPINSNTFVTTIKIFPFLLNKFSFGLLCRQTYAVRFSYPVKTLKQRPLLVNEYAVSMAHAVSPHDPRAIINRIKEPIYMIIGEKDQLFDPQKVISYFEDQAHVSFVQGATHMSILLRAASVIAEVEQEKQLSQPSSHALKK